MHRPSLLHSSKFMHFLNMSWRRKNTTITKVELKHIKGHWPQRNRILPLAVINKSTRTKWLDRHALSTLTLTPTLTTASDWRYKCYIEFFFFFFFLGGGNFVVNYPILPRVHPARTWLKEWLSIPCLKPLLRVIACGCLCHRLPHPSSCTSCRNMVKQAAFPTLQDPLQDAIACGCPCHKLPHPFSCAFCKEWSNERLFLPSI